MDAKTDGEKLFKKYLDLHGYSYVYEEIIPGKSKVLDFKIFSKAGGDVFCEVKDIAPKYYSQVGTRDPHVRIRREIHDVGKQFQEYRENICCLILSSQDYEGAPIWEPFVVFGAMLGNLSFCFDFDGESLSGGRLGFGKGGKMFGPSGKIQNTTFSAILVPSFTEDKKLRVVVHENPFSRKNLPRSIFCGPYDVRWAIINDTPNVVFRGEKVSDRDGVIKFSGQ